MDASATGIVGVAQIGVTVNDLESGTAFYRDTLGLSHQFTSNGMAFFDCGGVRLMLAAVSAQHPETHRSLLYFRTGDIERAAAMLIDRGVAIPGGAHLVARLPGKDVWLAEFRDREGHALALMSEVPNGS